jgi:hypothetical protein
VATLTVIFLQTIRIVRYKILHLKVEKIHFIWSLSYMQICTCSRPDIHQNRTSGIVFYREEVDIVGSLRFLLVGAM